MNVIFKNNKEISPDQENGVSIKYESPKRKGYKIRWYFILLLIISPVLYMINLFYIDFFVISAKGIVTNNPVIISSDFDVHIKDIFFLEGDIVKNNQLLIKINNKNLDFKNLYLEKKLQKLKKDIKKIPKINIHNYEKKIKEARNNFKKINDTKQSLNSWKEKGQISMIDYFSFNNIYTISKNNIYNEVINKNLTEIKIIEKNISSATTKLYNNIEREFLENQNQIKNLDIYSPFNGTIIEQFVFKDENVLKGNPILKISPQLTPEIHAYLEPKYILHTKKNKVVSIKFPNGTKTKGTIISKAQITNKLPVQLLEPFKNNNSLLKVIIKFKKTPDKTQWVEGMPVIIFFN